LKAFFSEFIAFKFGKESALKNRILRAHLDERLDLDEKFMDKITQLTKISERFGSKLKADSWAKLHRNIAALTHKRKQNVPHTSYLLG